jgi:hypothetical protein
MPLDDFGTALERAQTKFRATPSVEAEYTFKIGASPLGKVRIWKDSNKRLHFWSNSAVGNYECVETPDTLVELDHGAQAYNLVLASRGDVPPFEERGNAYEVTYPPFFSVDGLARILTTQAKKTFKRGVKEGGRTGDLLDATTTAQMGSAKWQLLIGPSGEILRATSEVNVQGNLRTTEWKMVSFRARNFSAKEFDLRVPDDYAPEALPGAGFPANPGSKPITTGWKQRAAVFDFARAIQGRITLLAYYDAELPSQRARAGVAELRKRGLNVVEVSGINDASSGLPVNPDGKSVARMNPVSFPYFVLLDSQSRIYRYWFGYRQEAKATWVSEILTATKSLK